MERILSLPKFKHVIQILFLMLVMACSSQVLAETLQETVAYTLETNPEVQIDLSRYRAGKEAVTIEKAGYLPKLDLEANLGWQRRDLRLDSGDDKTTDRITDATISLQQMLFDGFRTKNRILSSSHKSSSRFLITQARAHAVALKVSEVYLKVIRSEQQVELSRENLAVHDEIYDQIYQRTDSGLARASDLEQIRSRRARASANLVTAINNLSNARSEYFNVVNMKPVDLVMPQVDKAVLPVTLDEAMSMAGSSNPQLLAAGLEVKAMEAETKVADSSLYPRMDLELGQTWKDTKSDLATANGRTDQLGATLHFSYNIYNGGADRARRREAAFQVEEARASRDLGRRQVMRDLRLAWDAFIYMDGQLLYLREHIEASRGVARAYQQQFRLGKRSLLDLLDTENELFQSQRDFIQSVHEELFSRFQILYSVGSILETMNLGVPGLIQSDTGPISSLPADQ